MSITSICTMYCILLTQTLKFLYLILLPLVRLPLDSLPDIVNKFWAVFDYATPVALAYWLLPSNSLPQGCNMGAVAPVILSRSRQEEGDKRRKDNASWEDHFY